MLERLCALSSDLFCVMTAEGRFVCTSLAWETLLGHSPGRLADTPFMDHVHIEDRTATFHALESVRAGRLLQNFQIRYQGVDGTYRRLTWNMTRSLDDGLIYGVARDDTALHEAQDQGRRASDFLNSVVENVPDMVFIKDHAHRVVLLNRSGEEILGRPRETVIGRSNAELFSPEEAAFYSKVDQEVLDTAKPVEVPEEAMHTPHRGLRYLRVRKVPLLGLDGKPQYVLGIGSDITDRKAMQDQLRVAYQHLSELQEFRLKLINTVAHDLASPLTPIELQL